MSTSSSISVKFDAPEFSTVFKRIIGYQNKEGFYCVRLLNKFHSAQFEACIQSAKLNFENVRSLANSKFADQIRFLTVQVPNDLGDLNDLRYVSSTFLPNIQKVNIFFTEGQYADKRMTISQPLIFRGVHIFHDVSKNNNIVPYIVISGYNQDIQISETQDIQIIDCNFEGIGLCLQHASNVTVENSTFKNAQVGLRIFGCQHNASINKIFVQKRAKYGCYFNGVNQLNLNEVQIFDCAKGIQFFHSIGNIQNSIIDARNTGIDSLTSIVDYGHTQIRQEDGSLEQFTKIEQYYSVINEIL